MHIFCNLSLELIFLERHRGILYLSHEERMREYLSRRFRLKCMIVEKKALSTSDQRLRQSSVFANTLEPFGAHQKPGTRCLWPICGNVRTPELLLSFNSFLLKDTTTSMLKNITVVDLGLLGIGFYLIRAYLRQVNTPAPLPPGPRGLPVVGVSFQSNPMYFFSLYRNVECCRHAR